MAAIWYLALTSLLTVGQGFLERRYGRGLTPTRTGTTLFSRAVHG